MEKIDHTLTIIDLFPTPVGVAKFNRNLTQDELNFILNLEKEENSFNFSSRNSNILESKELSELKEFISSGLSHYFHQIYRPKNKIEIYITQSWVNYTNPGQKHHTHVHPNSLLSGVFYIQTENERDSITFHKSESPSNFLLGIEPEMNAYNAKQIKYKVEDNQLIMFPSTLHHSVDLIQGIKTRISISFNSFIKGEIGSYRNKTLLRL